MLSRSRSRCCVLGVLVTHAILLLAIVMAVVVVSVLYADTAAHDMPGDMRLLHLTRSTAFCSHLTVTAYPEQKDDSSYQNAALFDAWTLGAEEARALRRRHVERQLEGKNRLAGDARDYYSFHWMAGSQIHVQLRTESPILEKVPADTLWVFLLQGQDAWMDMKRQLLADPTTSPSCNPHGSCIYETSFTDSANVSLSINATDDYFMVLYTNNTTPLKASWLKAPDIGRSDSQPPSSSSSSSGSVPAPGVPPALPPALAIVWFQLDLNLTVYATDLKQAACTRTSEVSTAHAGDYVLLDFNPAYSPASKDLKDFSNIVVNVECHVRMLTYIAVFGLTAVALIIVTVVVTLYIITKQYVEDVSVNSGDYTRLGI